MADDKAKEFFGKAGKKMKSKLIPAIDVNVNSFAFNKTNQDVVEIDGDFYGWGKIGDCHVSVGISNTKLSAGMYAPTVMNNTVMLAEIDTRCDELLHLPDSQSEVVLEEIAKFRELRENFQSRGLLHKRGILLWGPPGSGKTCTIQLMVDLLVKKHGGIALQVHQPNLAGHALQMIRRVEPERTIVLIMEDLDALTQSYGEAPFLALLDGETQVDNIVHIATTNYPENLDQRFVDRPSRFDSIVWVGMPSADARRQYLMTKESEWDRKELEYLVDKSDEFSIAHLRELLILVKCLGYNKEDAVDRLSKMRFNRPNSSNSPLKKKLGFAR